MKSPPKQRKGEPTSDIEALWPTEPDTDAHNDKIDIMLELVQRNLELRERVRELEIAITTAINQIAWEGDYGATDTLKTALKGE